MRSNGAQDPRAPEEDTLLPSAAIPVLRERLDEAELEIVGARTVDLPAAEAAAPHVDALGCQMIGEKLIQGTALIGRRGLGKTAVLYIYPFESHGPRCLETYLDLWARWLEWFDTYVKNPAKKES